MCFLDVDYLLSWDLIRFSLMCFDFIVETRSVFLWWELSLLLRLDPSDFDENCLLCWDSILLFLCELSSLLRHNPSFFGVNCLLCWDLIRFSLMWIVFIVETQSVFFWSELSSLLTLNPSFFDVNCLLYWDSIRLRCELSCLLRTWSAFL